MSNDSTPQPIIDRTPGSETEKPDIAIAATPVGHESVYLGALKSTDGKTAHLRVFRAGYRVLFENKQGKWNTVPDHCDVNGVALGTAGIGRLGGLAVKLHALGFDPDDETIDFIDKLPASAATAYSVVRKQRSVVAADYLTAEVQALRDYSAGASLFRGY